MSSSALPAACLRRVRGTTWSRAPGSLRVETPVPALYRAALCGAACARPAQPVTAARWSGSGAGGSQQPPSSGLRFTCHRGGQPSALGRVGAESEKFPSPAPPADGRRRAGRTVLLPPASQSPVFLRRAGCSVLTSSRPRKSPLLPAHCRRLGCWPGNVSPWAWMRGWRAALLRWLAQADLE